MVANTKWRHKICACKQLFLLTLLLFGPFFVAYSPLLSCAARALYVGRFHVIELFSLLVLSLLFGVRCVSACMSRRLARSRDGSSRCHLFSVITITLCIVLFLGHSHYEERGGDPMGI